MKLMAITTHPKPLNDIFSSVTTATELKEYIARTPYLGKLLDMAVNAKWTTLDIDTVKFTRNDYHVSMAGALLLNRPTFSIIEQVLMESKIANSTKAKQFKALSEMLSQDESMILEAVLRKNLSELYPNLTHSLICEALV